MQGSAITERGTADFFYRVRQRYFRDKRTIIESAAIDDRNRFAHIFGGNHNFRIRTRISRERISVAGKGEREVGIGICDCDRTSRRLSVARCSGDRSRAAADSRYFSVCYRRHGLIGTRPCYRFIRRIAGQNGRRKRFAFADL